MIFVLANSLLLSFCSLGYQLTLALTLSDATEDFVLSQTLSLGLFLLGMGAGAWACGRSSRGSAAVWPRLLRVEWLLAVCGMMSASFVYFCESALGFVGVEGAIYLYLAVLPFVLWLGFLTGYELPLLLKADARLKPGHVLAANYLGAFAATVLVPIYLLPLLDVTGTAHALGAVNFLVASLILRKLEMRALTLIPHFAVALLVLAVVKFSPVWAGLHLKTVYFSPHFSDTASLMGSWNVLEKLEVPVRLRSTYQWIDILPAEFSSGVQGRQDFQLYLDRKLQVSSGTVKRYHESMVHGGVNLIGRVPRRVLILGGGDGLLARDLLGYSDLERIDLVEIDPAILRLARTQRDLRQLNGDSLSDHRVHVFTTDAFQFVRSTKYADGTERPLYDLVLIDLPFPVSYDLSLLFTKEFYALTRKLLADGGLILLDFPLPGGRRDYLPHIVHTLRAGGFSHLFAFGTEDFFLAAANRSLNFDYETLLKKVSNQTLTNLISRADDLLEAEKTPARVNSVLFPIRFGGVW